MLVEVQALVSPTSFGTPRRMSLGLDANRTSLLLAVLEKRVGLELLLGDDVFVSVAGGLEVPEPAADLGVAAAVASSFRNRPLPAAHRGLRRGGPGGRGARRRARPRLRLREAAQMGFTRCLLPARNLPDAALVPTASRRWACSRCRTPWRRSSRTASRVRLRTAGARFRRRREVRL